MSAFPVIDDNRRRAMLERRDVPTRVVIDTDTANEIDDQFALAWAFLSPDQIEVEAVVAEPYSFAHLRQRLLDAADELAVGEMADDDTTDVDAFDVWARNLAGKGIDPRSIEFVTPAEGMERSFEEIRTVMDKLGLGDDALVHRGSPGYLPSAEEPIESEGAARIIDAALADDERVLHVVAIGAVTNIASALLLEPRIAERMVVSWTSGYPTWTDVTNEPSLNLVQDVHASRLLFESGVPLVYLPGFYIGGHLRLSLPEMETWVKGRGAIGDYLHHLYVNNPLHAQRGISPFAGQSWVIWDLINIAWLINRSWVPSRFTADADPRRAARLAATGGSAADVGGLRDRSRRDLPRPVLEARAPGADPEGGRPMTTTTQAAVLHPGGGFSIEHRDAPLPGPGELLVQSMAVGICGSDLHYFHDGHIGDWWIREPHVLGHEFSGIVAATGDGVEHVAVGDRVVVEPIIPCGGCDSCRRGLYNLCTDFTFTGSPHTDGGLQQLVVVPARSAHPLPDSMSFIQGALVEPTSIAVHGVRRSGLTDGESVLVIGAGPIGLLLSAVALAKGAGSAFITDINPARLALASDLGVTQAIDVSDLTTADLLAATIAEGFDVVFEAVGRPETYATALEAVRPGGRIVAVGVNAEETIPFNLMLAQAKEATLTPVYLGRDAFPEAIELLADGLVDAEAFVSHRFPLAETPEAMATAAGDRPGAVAVKVIIEPPDLDDPSPETAPDKGAA